MRIEAVGASADAAASPTRRRRVIMASLPAAAALVRCDAVLLGQAYSGLERVTTAAGGHGAVTSVGRSLAPAVRLAARRSDGRRARGIRRRPFRTGPTAAS